jgi:hypothetical protein
MSADRDAYLAAEATFSHEESSILRKVSARLVQLSQIHAEMIAK